MRLLSFRRAGAARLGVERAEQIVDANRAVQLTMAEPDAVSARVIRAAEEFMPPSLSRALSSPTPQRIAALESALARADELVAAHGVEWAYDHYLLVDRERVTLCAPVSEDAKLFAIALNYATHAAEAAASTPEYPIVFMKPTSTMRGDGATVRIPEVTHRIDYEGEILVVIGERCRNVDRDAALSFVAGYCLANDVSARDWQRRTTQMMIGKAFDGFCPMGPVLVTADEAGPCEELEFTTTVNGELRQKARASEMIFDIPHLVSYLSQVVTLEPGDAIVTGTPAGVGAAFRPSKWLRAGDVVEVSSSQLGTLRTVIA